MLYISLLINKLILKILSTNFLQTFYKISTNSLLNYGFIGS